MKDYFELLLEKNVGNYVDESIHLLGEGNQAYDEYQKELGIAEDRGKRTEQTCQTDKNPKTKEGGTSIMSKKVKFEEAELQIVAMFQEGTCKDTIVYILEAMEFLDEEDEELKEIMESTVAKLRTMSESEFFEYDFSKYLFEEDEDES